MRRADSYPKQFAQFFRMASRAQGISIKLPTENDAHNLIHQLHSYRRSVEHEDSAQGLELRKVIIKRKGTNIEGSINPILGAIADAIDTASAPSEQELEDYLAQLHNADAGEKNDE